GGGPFLDVGQHDRRAGLAEGAPVRDTDAARTTGDDRHLAAQVEQLRCLHRPTSPLLILTAARPSSNIAAAIDSVKCFRCRRGGPMGSTTARDEVWTRAGFGS